MTNYTEVIYWLTLINESGLKLNIVKPIIQRWCITENRPLADIFSLSTLGLSTTFGLSDQQAEQLLNAVNKLEPQAAALTQLQSQGIQPLIRIDPHFPKRLIYNLSPVKHPLILWVHGATALLNQPGVTLLGRKESDEATTTFIDELMVALETEEIGLISGYGRGLDRETFEQMLATDNGFAVAMLPMGLSAFVKTTTRLDSYIEAGRTVLVSPFPPDTPFNEKLAEARNLLIDHMTMALLIPDSDDHAQKRAQTALERGLPVFVKANTDSNRKLLEQGALLLTDPGEVIEWVQQALVDDAMQESTDEAIEQADLPAAPLAATAPSDPPQSDDDYSLHGEETPPLDPDEAIEVLSLGGEIPDVLRQRLEKKSEEEEDDDDDD